MSFLALPYELRRMIWEHALPRAADDNDITVYAFNDDWRAHASIPRLMAANFAVVQPVATPKILNVNTESQAVALEWIAAQGCTLKIPFKPPQ